MASAPTKRTTAPISSKPEVWGGLVSDLMKDPEQLREDLETMIELERWGGRRGDPDREAKAWLEKLTEADRMLKNYQEMAVKGLMTFDKLAQEIGRLEQDRSIVERELGALRTREERIEQLERDKEALLESHEVAAPGALEQLSPEERDNLYKMLRLKVKVYPIGDVGVDGEPPLGKAQ